MAEIFTSVYVRKTKIVEWIRRELIMYKRARLGFLLAKKRKVKWYTWSLAGINQVHGSPRKNTNNFSVYISTNTFIFWLKRTCQAIVEKLYYVITIFDLQLFGLARWMGDSAWKNECTFIHFCGGCLPYTRIQNVLSQCFLAFKKLLMIKFSQFLVCKCFISFPIWIHHKFL